MEIEQKERERIEADIDAYIKDLWHDVHSPNNNSPKIVEAITHFRAGKQSEHLHLQKEVIQPLRKSLEDEQATAQHWLTEYKKLEAEIKALREAAQNLVTAIEQRSFFQEGYRNGSASISEVMAAGDVEVKAYEAMGKLLTKNEG
jgi:uncharacterized Fe-S cluster-containing radical SAM superfamily enzyme